MLRPRESQIPRLALPGAVSYIQAVHVTMSREGARERARASDSSHVAILH